jgi:dienelactone hydrolase
MKRYFWLLLFCCWPLLAAETVFWPAELQALPVQARASWQAGQDFANWQQQGRQLLRQSYLWPQQSLPPVSQARLVQRLEQGSYWREHWQLQLLTPVWQQVWLLVPKTASAQQQAPAVLLLHDHGAEFRLGKDKWIRPLQPGKFKLAAQWADKYFSGQFFGEQLAAAGFVVLAGDMLGFGERGPLPYSQQQQLAANFQARGLSLSGFVALEDQMLANWLARRPEVASGQLSAVGFSLGAYRAWQLAALSEVVSSAVGIGWFNQFANLTTVDSNLSQGQTAFYLLHPGLNAQLDLPDVLALAAPKPLLILQGEQDALMPVSGVQQGSRRLQQLYQACVGAAVQSPLRALLLPAQGHSFPASSQALVLHQLQQWAKHRAKPVACIASQPSVANALKTR